MPTDETTENQRKAIGRYIRWVADKMELRDWTFTLSEKPAPGDCCARVYPTYGRKLAVIELGDRFLTDAPEEQRNTIVHELVHCHLEPACNMVLNDLEEILGKAADQVFFSGFKRQIEYGVDALAAALAKHLPVIDWTDIGDDA